MGKITLLPETTKYPLQLIGKRAGICWGADIENEEKNKQRAIDCIHSGHGRVLEYVMIDYIAEEYSARAIREVTRHIGGSPTYLQASTRYINYKDVQVVIPPSVLNNRIAKDIYMSLVDNIRESYELLKDAGVPKEDCAMILPMGMTTKVTEHRNLRNLENMFNQRLCTRAYWEARKYMTDLYAALFEYSDEWQWICMNMFKPKCEIKGYCTESKCCGRKPKKDNA